MVQQISDLDIRKIHNKQYILFHTTLEQNDILQHPNTSEHLPKSPSITSQDREEVIKCKHQTFGTEIYESEYLLPSTPENNTNKENEVDIEPRQDQDKDSITSFRTIHSKITPIGHSTELPRQTDTVPITTAKDYADIIDDIGLEGSASQISITHPPEHQKMLTSNTLHQHHHLTDQQDLDVYTIIRS